ncbi:MAG: hypothetical protein AMXMBFR36_27890 [Acidobacteriota bacterium]
MATDHSLTNRIAEGLAPARPLPRFAGPNEIEGLANEARGIETTVRSLLHEYQNRLGDRSLLDFNERVQREKKNAIQKELDERLAGPVGRLREIRNALADQTEHYASGAIEARATFAAITKNPAEFMAFDRLFASATGSELVELARYVSQPSVARIDLALLAQRRAEQDGGDVQDVVRSIVRSCPRPPAETSTAKRLESLIAEVDLILIDAEALRGGNVAHKRLEAAFRRGGLGNQTAPAVAS